MSNKCKRCGRPLKSEESISIGYGKRCYNLAHGIEESIKKPKRQIKGYF